MDPEFGKSTTFRTPTSHYEWLCMLFELIRAPIVIQRMITTLLGNLKDKTIFAYLDDIILTSPDEDSYLASLEAVLERPRLAGLKVKLFKCEFLKKN